MSKLAKSPRYDEIRRRTQKIQKMLSLRDPEVTGDRQALSAPVYTGPPPCRAALAHWPDEWRERWGRLANALEESGLNWQEAEARAFVEVWNQRRAESRGRESEVPRSLDPERN